MVSLFGLDAQLLFHWHYTTPHFLFIYFFNWKTSVEVPINKVLVGEEGGREGGSIVMSVYFIMASWRQL